MELFAYPNAQTYKDTCVYIYSENRTARIQPETERDVFEPLTYRTGHPASTAPTGSGTCRTSKSGTATGSARTRWRGPHVRRQEETEREG